MVPVGRSNTKSICFPLTLPSTSRALEVEGKVSGKQIDFVFDLPTGTNAKTMADEKRRAKVLALYIAQPKERKRLYKFSPRYAGLDEDQIKDLLKNFNRNRSGDKIFQNLVEHYQRLAMEDTFDFSEYFASLRSIRKSQRCLPLLVAGSARLGSGKSCHPTYCD